MTCFHIAKEGHRPHRLYFQGLLFAWITIQIIDRQFKACLTRRRPMDLVLFLDGGLQVGAFILIVA